MKRYWKYVKPYLYAFILGPILMITEVVGEVVLPALMAQIINVGAANHDIAYIIEMGGVMILTAFVMMGGGIGGAWFAAKASISFGADLRNDCFQKVQKFSFQNIDSFSTGSLVTRLTNDITQVQNLIMMGLRMMLRAPGMLIGAIIMVHGDDEGLVLPPHIAPIQVAIIPIRADANKEILENCKRLKSKLEERGIRVVLDNSNKTPGWKFAQYEMKGIPLRIELGPKDLEKQQFMLTRRFDGSKITVSLDNPVEEIINQLEEIHKGMYNKALGFLNEHINEVHSLEELGEVISNSKGFAKMMSSNDPEEEKKIKKILGKNCIGVYHIGSTSVKNMPAKPVIDIMPVVKDLSLVDSHNKEFEALGYECRGEFGIPGRRFFAKGGDNRTHHIHIFEQSNQTDIQRHIAVRDYLRSHPDTAAEYAALKKKLAEEFPYDNDGYCDGKEEYMKSLEEKSLRWQAKQNH